jgi:hypothetical protein
VFAFGTLCHAAGASHPMSSGPAAVELAEIFGATADGACTGAGPSLVFSGSGVDFEHAAEAPAPAMARTTRTVWNRVMSPPYR